MPLTYHFATYRLKPEQRLLANEAGPMKLGGRAFDLLVVLIERRDRTVSRDELMDLVWPRLVVEENNLQVQVLALRKLLGHGAIATVPGRGYRFTLPVHEEGGELLAPTAGSNGNATPTAAKATSFPGACSNLPHWEPVLHGRDEALGALLACLDRHRWVTVAGPAGVGKTRLARLAARQRVAVMPGGVWWIDLAALTDPALLPAAAALAMGVAPDAAPDLTLALAARLSEQATLLVLDNVEHLADGVASFIARLRPRASALHLLLTSQEVLHAADEQVFRLGPLGLPANDSLAASEASGAVQLFVARAQAADRGFRLDVETCAAVADICRELDGIPLAIELAAARLPLLGVEGLRARLDQRLQLLTVGDRTQARRHRTLREAMQWSYQLLSADEQTVFRRLGVFAGGFTLSAAQAMADDEQGIDPWDVLEHLGRLVDKSLVAAEGDAQPRYRLLETVRLFALEKLIEHGEADAARAAHRAHFVAVAEAAREAMERGRPGGLELLDLERDNLFVAVAWTRGDAGGIEGLRLAEALDSYWLARGMISFGLEHARAALAHPQAQVRTPLRCRVELYAAGLCSLGGHLEDALWHATRALETARSLGDDAGTSFALALLSQIHEQSNDLAAAQRYAEQALTFARRAPDASNLRRALVCLGAVHERCGRPELSLQMEEEALASCHAAGLLRFEAEHHLNLAWLHCERGQAQAALAHLHQALSLLPRVGSQYFGVSALRTAASWAVLMQRHEQALQCFAAFTAQCVRIGLREPLQPWEVARRQQAAAAVSAAACERAQREGRAWSYGEALDAAMNVLAAHA